MNARSAVTTIIQLAEAAGGNPAAIAGLVQSGIGAVASLRGAKTPQDQLAAGQQLFGVVNGLLNRAEGEELTEKEKAEVLAELDVDTDLLRKKFDFTPGGSHG